MRLIMPFAIAVAASGLALTLAPTSASAASFDCTRARTGVERTICGNRPLEDRDVKMATLYSVNRQLAGGMGALGAIADRQRDWLAERNRCGANSACLRTAYDRRIGELERGVQASQGR